MFQGSVNFRAGITGYGLKFQPLDFRPPEPGVERVGIAGPDGRHITGTVYLAPVPTVDEGRRLATRVMGAVLTRVAYEYGIAVGAAEWTGDHFTTMGVHSFTSVVPCRVEATVNPFRGIDPADLRLKLEQPAPPGERFFGMFCTALHSSSRVEEYMHLYQLLLMLFEDSQPDLDAFVVSQEPSVPRTGSPKKPGVSETVYTRLRNEFAHARRGVDLAATKAEMATRLGGLRELVKTAIETVG